MQHLWIVAHADGTIIITSRVLPRFYSRREIEIKRLLCKTRASKSPFAIFHDYQISAVDETHLNET